MRQINFVWLWVADHATVLAAVTAAIATIAIAVFTFTLWRSTHRLWKATVGALEFSKRALTDLERPYVFIYEPHFEGSETQQISIGYTISNNGKLAAIIDEVHIRCGIIIDKKLPKSVAILDHNIYNNPIIFPNEVRKSNLHAIPASLLKSIGASSSSPESGIIFQVRVIYRGPFPGVCDTAQCWRFRSWPNTGFMLIHDPQYTYAR